MVRTITGKYGSATAARNTHEDLIGIGFPNEKVFLAREKAEVQVITPNDAAREVRCVLRRHGPTEITESIVF